MNRIDIYLLFFVIIFLLSCKKTADPADSILSGIDYKSEISMKKDLSKLLGKYRLIRLETNDSCLIGRNSKILKRHENFYIHTKNEILKFNNAGTFSGKLSRQGGGPGEYVDIYDFDVLNIHGKEELWVSTSGSIKIYDASSFDYLREINVGKMVNQFKYINDNVIILRIPGDSILAICNQKGEVKERFLKKDLANSLTKFIQFFTYNGEVGFQIDDTQMAVVYDPKTKSLKEKKIINPLDEYLLTPQINQNYYDKFGYMDQCEKVAETYTLLSAVRVVGETAILIMKYPDRKTITVSRCGHSDTYAYSPSSTYLNNDIVSTKDLDFLTSIVACDSDDSFLFIIPAEKIDSESESLGDNKSIIQVNPDDNPLLLELYED